MASEYMKPQGKPSRGQGRGRSGLDNSRRDQGRRWASFLFLLVEKRKSLCYPNPRSGENKVFIIFREYLDSEFVPVWLLFLFIGKK